jgi:hypothetical protein
MITHIYINIPKQWEEPQQIFYTYIVFIRQTGLLCVHTREWGGALWEEKERELIGAS